MDKLLESEEFQKVLSLIYSGELKPILLFRTATGRTIFLGGNGFLAKTEEIGEITSLDPTWVIRAWFAYNWKNTSIRTHILESIQCHL